MKALKLSLTLAFAAGVCLFSTAYTGVIPRSVVNAQVQSIFSSPVPKTTNINVIPVLLYHGIVSPNDRAKNSVTLTAFHEQMEYLHNKKYHTISPMQYTEWAEGKHPSLPENPILITFDCGQTSALLAQPTLEQYGFRPVMYVVSGFADHSYGDYYLTWAGLKVLAYDGWYMQFHAGPCGHGYISVDTPYDCDYGWKFKFTEGAKTGHRYYSQTFGQSAAVYRARVKRDINIGMTSMQKAFGMPMRELHETFAVPWSDYGQPATSSIPWLGKYFASQFEVVFIQDNYPSSVAAHKLHMRYRFEVDDPTTISHFTSALEDPRFALKS